jgi:hypothetical protein
MREGTARGHHGEDIEGDVIRIRHNWQDGDGIKAPKCGGFRTVFLDDGLKEALEVALKAYRREEGGPSAGLVFGREKDGNPVSAGFLFFFYLLFYLLYLHSFFGIDRQGASPPCYGT